MSMSDYQLNQATNAYDAMIDMAERQDAMRAEAKAEFLREPSPVTFIRHMDLGDGPTDLDLAQFVITEAQCGNPRAKRLLDAVAYKVAQYTEVEP